MQGLVDHVVSETLKYLEGMPKAKRKSIGQFFTSAETARYMAAMLVVPQKTSLSILDPGAGSGILTAAVVEYLQNNPFIKHIKLTCYETSKDVLPILRHNLLFLKANSCIPIDSEIVEQNYITSQGATFNCTFPDKNQSKYDWIICNPPYKKIAKDADEAACMSSICHGAPNLYFLFTAMGLFNLDLIHLNGNKFLGPRRE